MSASLNQTRRFAPLRLGTDKDEVDGRMVLKGVVFDVDGTLCRLFCFFSPSCFGFLGKWKVGVGGEEVDVSNWDGSELGGKRIGVRSRLDRWNKRGKSTGGRP